MYLLIVVLFFFGVLCGILLRFLSFAIVLLAATGIVALAMALQGEGMVALSAIVTVLVLQIGYTAGIILRSAAAAWCGKLRGNSASLNRNSPE